MNGFKPSAQEKEENAPKPLWNKAVRHSKWQMLVVTGAVKKRLLLGYFGDPNRAL
jgi:hypothetical protein